LPASSMTGKSIFTESPRFTNAIFIALLPGLTFPEPPPATSGVVALACCQL
jgi:hypothetical protein